MDDLEAQIRAWTDSQVPDDVDPVSAREIIAGNSRAVDSAPEGAPQTEPAELLKTARLTRSGKRPLKHTVLVAAGVAIVAAGLASVLFLTTRTDGHDTVTAHPPETSATSEPAQSGPTRPPTTSEPSGEQIPFEILGQGVNTNFVDDEPLAYAVTQDVLDSMWSEFGLKGHPRQVDFSEQVVVAITDPTGPCPPTLESIGKDGSDVTAAFSQPDGPCAEPYLPPTVLVALDWAVTGDSFRLVLHEPWGSGSEATLQVDRSADGPFTNPVENAILGALDRLDLEPCCGEPSHGGSDASVGAVWDGINIPIYGSPIETATSDLEGTSRAFVAFNDYVLSAAPAKLDGHQVLTGEADGGAFVAFTCGPNVWSIGGLAFGDRIGAMQVRGLAAALIPELGCQVGELPVAPGHGDPLATEIPRNRRLWL